MQSFQLSIILQLEATEVGMVRKQTETLHSQFRLAVVSHEAPAVSLARKGLMAARPVSSISSLRKNEANTCKPSKTLLTVPLLTLPLNSVPSRWASGFYTSKKAGDIWSALTRHER